jgi:nitrite reductase (NO-forming)
VPLYALPTDQKVGLAVVGALFVLFALASSFLFPRFRPNYPGRGLPAFIVVSLVFFFGMLTAVEVFGAEPKEAEPGAKTEAQPQATTTAAAPTQATTTSGTTTAAAPASKPQTIEVTEKEFKITLDPAALHAGAVTFRIKNIGKLPHDLAIVGGPKSKLISPGGTGTLTATLKAGPIELYCSVPGHKQAGMDVKTTVSGGAAAAPPATTTTAAAPAAKPQTIQVTEKEFKITLAPATLHAGPVTFQIKSAGALPHDLAIVGGSKSELIKPGGTATLKATLKAGPIELYCSVPGHKQAGMDVKTTVS